MAEDDIAAHDEYVREFDEEAAFRKAQVFPPPFVPITLAAYCTVGSNQTMTAMRGHR